MPNEEQEDKFNQSPIRNFSKLSIKSPQNLPVYIKDESCVTPLSSVNSEEENLEKFNLNEFDEQQIKKNKFPLEIAFPKKQNEYY